jgi:hypothetical protein
MKTKTERKLYDLPDSEFAFGGKFDEICRKAGYASGRAAANDLNLWSATVEDAIATVSSSSEPEGAE